MMTIATLAAFQQTGEAGVAPVSLSLAFGAGLLSALSPCGFGLLFAYLTYAVRQQAAGVLGEPLTGRQTLLRAGALGLPLVGGVLLVLLGAAGVLALGGQELSRLFPWLTVAVGAGIALLGGWGLLTGRTLSLPGLGALAASLGPAGRNGQARPRAHAAPGLPSSWPSSARAARAAWIFRLGYGLVSLGCALPVFFLLIGTAMTSTGMGGLVLVVAAYATGVAMFLLAVIALATTMGDLLRSAVFPLLGRVQRLSSLLVIGAGLYIVVAQVRVGL